MIQFVQNLVAIDYLKATNQLIDSLEDRIKQNLRKGYQDEMNYKHPDGSFSVWGPEDSSGSTFLTAYVIRYFRQAKTHIYIDQQIVDKALKWLVNVQKADGSIPEVGPIYHTDMQSGANKGIALTAYVIICFLEGNSFSKSENEKYKTFIDKALNNVANCNCNKLYACAVASYALQLGNHAKKNDWFKQFDNKANTEGDLKWWGNKRDHPDSTHVEITAYGLLTTMARGTISDGRPIMKWLVKQSNYKGGYESTQVTSVGLTALAKYTAAIETIQNTEPDLQISFQYTSKGAKKEEVKTINKGNKLFLQVFSVSYK